AVAGEAVGVVGEQFQVAAERGAAAEGFDGRGVVVPHRVVQAADDGQPVHDPGAVRQVLADADPGRGGGDGAERAAHLGRGVRLRVPGVEVAGAAVVEDDDAVPHRGGGRRRPAGG